MLHRALVAWRGTSSTVVIAALVRRFLYERRSGPVRLTKEAVQRLEAELTMLVDVEAPRVRTMVEEAKGAGDNSQNPDFFIAAEEEANVLARMKRVRDALEAHSVASQIAVDTETVQPGVFVDLDFGDGPECFYVGSISAAGGGTAVLTPESRVGASLLGKRVGDVCDGVKVLAIRAEG